MKTKTIWVIILAIIVVGLMIFAASSSSPTSSPNTPANQTSTTSQTQSTSTPAQATSSASSTSAWVKFEIQKTGFTFLHPQAWTIASVSPTVSLDNFNHALLGGGVVPEHGAIMDISTTTTGLSLKDFIAGNLVGASILSSSTVTVDGTSCSEVLYEDTYSASVASKNVGVYCPRGTTLWKMYLSYRKGDSEEAQFADTFSRILSSLQFSMAK